MKKKSQQNAAEERRICIKEFIHFLGGVLQRKKRKEKEPPPTDLTRPHPRGRPRGQTLARGRGLR